MYNGSHLPQDEVCPPRPPRGLSIPNRNRRDTTRAARSRDLARPEVMTGSPHVHARLKDTTRNKSSPRYKCSMILCGPKSPLNVLGRFTGDSGERPNMHPRVLTGFRDTTKIRPQSFGGTRAFRDPNPRMLSSPRGQFEANVRPIGINNGSC